MTLNSKDKRYSSAATIHYSNRCTCPKCGGHCTATCDKCDMCSKCCQCGEK